jgi:hypothetical protein
VHGAWRGYCKPRDRCSPPTRACRADRSTGGLSAAPKQCARVPWGEGTARCVGLRGALTGIETSWLSRQSHMSFAAIWCVLSLFPASRRSMQRKRCDRCISSVCWHRCRARCYISPLQAQRPQLKRFFPTRSGCCPRRDIVLVCVRALVHVRVHSCTGTLGDRQQMRTL